LHKIIEKGTLCNLLALRKPSSKREMSSQINESDAQTSSKPPKASILKRGRTRSRFCEISALESLFLIVEKFDEKVKEKPAAWS